MTEKRFIFVGSGIEDNVDNESYLYNKDGFQDVCDLLNELHEENERLKNQRRVYDKFLDLNDLEIEWQFLCDADECNEKEDMDCRDCKYLGVLE